MAFQAEMSDDTEVLVVAESEVMQDLPDFFSIDEDGKLTYDEARVNVFCYKKKYMENAAMCRKVQNIEEFQTMKQRLLTLPIYIRAIVQYDHKLFSTKIQKTPIFIIVNTAHPAIKAQLKERLDKAEDAYNRGAKFSVEFRFGKEMPFKLDACIDAKYVVFFPSHADFCITNFRRRVQNCYDSSAILGPSSLVLLIGVGIYRLYRHIAAKDFVLEPTYTVTKIGSLMADRPTGTEEEST